MTPAALRWIGTPPLAVLVALLLFLLMEWLIRPPPAPPEAPRLMHDVAVIKPPPDTQQQTTDMASLDAAPPPPPAAPPSLARPDLPAIAAPAISALPLDISSIKLPAAAASGGLRLGSGGAFGGFAGSGAGGNGNGGGSGYGIGQGFVGKKLIPLSTARPQMPEWACAQKIRGWVEVVFVVLPSGKVSNVRLIDADPKGVFEAAAIESVGHWLYPRMPKASEVKQRVEMDPADCAYNWQ